VSVLSHALISYMTRLYLKTINLASFSDPSVCCVITESAESVSDSVACDIIINSESPGCQRGLGKNSRQRACW